MRKFLLGFVVGILVLPVAAWAGAWLGMFPISAKAVPGKWETVFAHLALDEAAARHAPRLTNPVAPTEENLMAGVKLFKGDCAGCHGDPNSPVTERDASGLYPNPQVFAHHPPSKPDYELFWIIKGGVRYSAMFAWDGQFGRDASGKDVSDEKIWTAVTFLTHLNSLPPAVDAEWRKKAAN
jgi:mono/diheme cytochrome c family protein